MKKRDWNKKIEVINTWRIWEETYKTFWSQEAQ